jgi:hypothetical protein
VLNCIAQSKSAVAELSQHQQLQQQQQQQQRGADVRDVTIQDRRPSAQPFFLEFEAKDLSATFKLGEKLGEGAFSTVKEGTHIRSGKVS